MSNVIDEKELLEWLKTLSGYDYSWWNKRDKQAYGKIQECIREAFSIPTTSEREEELEKALWEMQKELDKIGANKDEQNRES